MRFMPLKSRRASKVNRPSQAVSFLPEARYATGSV
jgi:hypothetical protein